LGLSPGISLQEVKLTSGMLRLRLVKVTSLKGIPQVLRIPDTKGNGLFYRTDQTLTPLLVELQHGQSLAVAVFLWPFPTKLLEVCLSLKIRL
jgi:hypothetical protein